MNHVQYIPKHLINFDPEGSGYDLASARQHGMVRDRSGHFGSVVPVSQEDTIKYSLPPSSYMMLKGKDHETWDKAVAGEEARNYKIEKFGTRYYSVPKSQDTNFKSYGIVDKVKDFGYDLWKKNVPIHKRFFLQTLFGDRNQPLTEKDITKDEQQQIEKNIEYRLRYLRGDSDELGKKMLETHMLSRNDPDLDMYRILNLYDLRTDLEEKEYHRLENSLAKKYFPKLDRSNMEDWEQARNELQGLDSYHWARKKRRLDEELHRLSTKGGPMLENLGLDNIDFTLGRYHLIKHPDGTNEVIDEYDFMNPERAPRVRDYQQRQPLDKATEVGRTLWKILSSDIPDKERGIAGEVGMAYIGDKGRPVNIKFKAPRNK